MNTYLLAASWTIGGIYAVVLATWLTFFFWSKFGTVPADYQDVMQPAKEFLLAPLSFLPKWGKNLWDFIVAVVR